MSRDLCEFIIFSLPHVQHERWRVSSVNRGYSACPSYPATVIVPKDVDDDMLMKVAKFRQGGRFPVVCYCHRKNGRVRLFRTPPPSPDPPRVKILNRQLVTLCLQLLRLSYAAVSRWLELTGNAARRTRSSFRRWSTAPTKVTSLTCARVSRRSRPGWQVEGSSPSPATPTGRGCTDRWRGVNEGTYDV